MSAREEQDRYKDQEAFSISEDEPVYTTGVVSRLLGIPVHVLKQLDEENVVSPPREKGKARLYSEKELLKVRKCWFYMNEHNVKVHGLKVILDMENTAGEG